jgi:beta-lactamase regulating signal transducer with metallopeptidase domain/elongation factor P hydroxylase
MTMELSEKFMCVLGSSSLWLAGSGLVLWLCLRSRLQISPRTRAAATILVALQGWIWIGIPVEVDAVWINSVWIQPQPIDILPQQAAAGDAARAVMATALPFDSGRSFAASSISDAVPVAASPVPDVKPLVARSIPDVMPLAARSMPRVMPMAGAAAAAIWIAGIAIILGRSIRGFVALSRMVQALPRAPAEWQNELSALCRQQAIGRPLILKISNVATPTLVQTWGAACIVIPAWLWESCTAEQRTSILLHELAHYRRGDIWRQLAMRLVVLPHWFNPVAWWAAWQFEAASEAACDEAACCGDLGRAISYSKALLVLNERLGIRYAQALAISGGSLTERIRRVLHPELRKERQMSRVLILSVMIMLAGLATIRIQAAGQSSRSKREAAKDERAKAVSLLANGGFEEPQEESDDPEAWFGTRIPQTAGHYLLSASSSVAHRGERSVVVEIGASHPDMKVAYNWTAVAKGWKAGETYELSGWVKTENAKRTAFIMAQYWSEEGQDGKMIGGATTQFSSPVKGTTDWTRVSTRLKVPEGTGVVRIRAGLASEENLGAKAWFDDVSLVKVARSANESTRNEAARAPGASLIANGGFEESQEESDDPESWYGTRIPQTAGHFQLSSSSVAHRGERSVFVEIGDSHPDRKVAYNWTAVAKGWKAGETYELSGWVKTENAKRTAFIMVQFWDEEGQDGKMIGGATTQFSDPVRGTTDWTRVSTRLTVPEGTGVVRIRAGLASEENLGAKAWFDDISLVKVAKVAVAD